MFSFKQFTIQQDRTAMKVCTDACVLGAYADVGSESHEERILDIGTGTGLLAIMAAQRNPTALIDAVEVDDAAFGQACENVIASSFAERMNVVHARIQEFYLTPDSPPIKGEGSRNVSESAPLSYKRREAGRELLYDRILTNPPFYTNHLRSLDAAVNRALHTDELPFPELIDAVVRLMKPDGQWWVLLPPFETGKLTQLAQQAGLSPFKQLLLRHNMNKPVFRIITGFSFGQHSVLNETLNIYETDAQMRSGSTYTLEFRRLLRDFYLIF